MEKPANPSTCSSCGTTLDPAAGCPTCLLALAIPPPPSTITTAPGDTIGPYQLGAIIGQGGMGTVFRATGPPPLNRELALKLITSHNGDSGSEILLRFNAERQALALMDHPGIAKIHDAADTADGAPYFVMELCPGQAATRFCTSTQRPPESRLETFLKICDAVQHAHQKGIIHRDLKPSNILASESGIKVIDFGIAKALNQKLTDLTLLTSSGHFLGTPAYASPEQLLAQPTDTRTDIYSLGCILYEFLTDTAPYPPELIAATPLPELHLLLTQRDPEIPSARAPQKQIPQDLDWITMRAIEKAPAHRYATVNEFADDIRRHLDHLPVHASPPSITYRIRKFTRRHRWPISAATAIIIALLGGIITTTVQATRAKNSERDMAEQKDRADELVAFMLGNHFERLDRPGDQKIKVETARAVIADLESLPLEKLTRANQRTLGKAYWKAGGILLSAGEWDDGRSAFNQGATLWQQLAENDQTDLDALYKQGLNTNGRGWAEEKIGNTAAALQSYQQAVEILESLNIKADTAAKPVWKLKLRTAYRNYSRNLVATDPSLAEEIGNKGLTLIRKMRAEDPDNSDFLQAETDSLQCLIPILLVNKPDEAIAAATGTVTRKRAQAELNNQHPDHQTGVAVALSFLSDTQAAAGYLPAAIQSREEMAQIYRSYNAQFPEQTNIRALLASQLVRLAEYHYRVDQKPKCVATLTESQNLFETLIAELGEKSPDTWHTGLAEIKTQLGTTTKR